MTMNVFERFKSGRNYGLKVLILTVVMVIFLIPQGLILSLVEDRARLAREALDSMYQPLGGQPAWAGPFVSVPMEFRELDEKGSPVLRTRTVYLAPERSTVDMAASVSELRRGIYRGRLVNLETSIQASFRFDSPAVAALEPHSVDWSKAALFIMIPDARLLAGEAHVAIEGLAGGRLRGQASPARDYRRSLAFGLDLSGKSSLDGRIDFTLRGGNDLSVALAGGDNTVTLASSWAAPSFHGFILPAERSVTDEGFSAEWFLPESVSAVPAAFWGEGYFDQLSEAAFGVSLIEPVDANRKTFRAARYAFMFVVIPFGVLFLFEVFTACRLHPIQYGLIGFANMVFYLLLLSISEYAGFGLAYLVAALATSLAVGLYFRAIARGHRSWWAGIASMASLYGLLYAMLLSEDYALLIGSVCLFAGSSAVLWFTRKIDWYGEKRD